MTGQWIAVDWGTTNFRAFLMSESGDCLDTIQAPKGLLSVKHQQFPEEFDGLIHHWTESHGPLPVIMAGMVGSQQGWCEVPYLPAPATISDIAKGSKAVTLLPGIQAKIVAGVLCQNAFGHPDVMRGEEVQLVGLSDHLQQDFTAILCGTHSKHAVWKNDQLMHFSTVMTGELYSVLTSHSLLGKALPEQEPDEAVFNKGLDIGISHPLNHVLFSARSFRLTKDIKETHVHSYISGLLIGHELSKIDEQEEVHLVGSKGLSNRYSNALSYLNIRHQIHDGDQCFLKGMTTIYNNENCNEH